MSERHEKESTRRLLERTNDGEERKEKKERRMRTLVHRKEMKTYNGKIVIIKERFESTRSKSPQKIQ